MTNRIDAHRANLDSRGRLPEGDCESCLAEACSFNVTPDPVINAYIKDRGAALKQFRCLDFKVTDK